MPICRFTSEEHAHLIAVLRETDTFELDSADDLLCIAFEKLCHPEDDGVKGNKDAD